MFHWFRKPKHKVLPFATDIHCHLTPGIDDGSPDVDKSVVLLRHMEGWGIRRIVMTPHVTEDTFENTPATIDPAFGSLVAGARDAGIGIGLLPPSGEYRMDSFFVKCLGEGVVRSLPGGYLLVENSFNVEPWNIDELLFDLAVKGFRPVLAHPERYVYYHSKPSRYKKLHQSGVFMQCNLLSFAGYYGKDVRQMAYWMLDNGLVDFMGTDLHGMRHVEAIARFMSTRDFDRLSRRVEGQLLNDLIK
ncbi:MAG: hypothetical protein K2L41_06545 [Muribaculaceae bacterium]|nr:hypothetical protein [Muribaculaceae bacterium]